VQHRISTNRVISIVHLPKSEVEYRSMTATASADIKWHQGFLTRVDREHQLHQRVCTTGVHPRDPLIHPSIDINFFFQFLIVREIIYLWSFLMDRIEID
jgi:hypothetical protein